MGSESLQSALFALLGGAIPCLPYQWQIEAFERFCRGDIPSEIVAPTAAGKTMMLPTYIAALARQAVLNSQVLPRRLVFVVNRRVLVDEATNLSETILRIVERGEIPELTQGLKRLSASGVPLVVSTLRGQYADNGLWSADPSTPAIILTTPDMLGSRLLFRGYGGLGKNRGPLQAGLLGVDTLIIHDESHLAPAFGSLLRTIESESAWQADKIQRPRLQVIEMTATLRPGAAASRPPLRCEPSADPALMARMSAHKRLLIAPVANVKERERSIVALVRQHAAQQVAIAIFVASPDEAAKLEVALIAGKSPVLETERVAVLTGTMRGAEREALLGCAAWQRVAASRSQDGETAVLIATGAGEIGIDLDANVLVCDEASIDRQIQRFGRCNRRGQGSGQVIVMPLAKERTTKTGGRAGRTEKLAELRSEATRLLHTLPTLEGLAFDASPLALSALRSHPDYAKVIEPAPITRMLEPGILDLFAATSHSLRALAAPDPALWIHGLIEEEAEVNLLWRHVPNHAYAEWLEHWPVHRRECARLPLNSKTRELVDALNARGATHVLDARGQYVGTFDGGSLPNGGYLVIACQVGGLSVKGLPNAAATVEVTDVSALQFDQGEIACHSIAYREADGQWACDTVLANSVAELIAALHPDQYCAWHDLSGDRLTVWLHAPDALACDSDEMLTTQARRLDQHLELTARAAIRIAHALNLPEQLTRQFERAGRIHDLGKARTCWQHAIGNFDAEPLGKSGSTRFSNAANAGYRHELGSLVDCQDRDPLVRQMVAAHHGHARPSAPAAALFHSGCAAIAHEAFLGHASATREFGHWGLAYLEALLKCADVMAESHAGSLAADASLASVPAEFAHSQIAEASVWVGFDPTNPGEYQAALGLLWLLAHETPTATLAWQDDGCVFAGVEETQVMAALTELTKATAAVDEYRSGNMKAEGSAEASDAKYPPLLLSLYGRQHAINAWCNERFSSKSSWKLAAGRSDGLQTLRVLISQCAESLPLENVDALRLVAKTRGLATKGKKPRGSAKEEASRFRYDAATGWTALDVGWSPYEEKMSFARPWIEVLALLGIQAAFPPPSRRDDPYHTWTQALPLQLVRIAARGLTPDRRHTYRPQYRSSGQNLDTYSATPNTTQGATACPQLLII